MGGSEGTLLVVSGEPSGDVAASRVVRELAHMSHVARGKNAAPRVVAVGGDALAAAGATLLAHVSTLAAMGTSEVASRGFALLSAVMRIRSAVNREAPSAALLVGFSEVNARLYPMLKSRGIPTVFYGLPQVWAWRSRRMATPIGDVLCATLPFEAALWASRGHDARFVGHPALEVPCLPKRLLRESLGLPPRAPCVAILPGSRPQEIQRMLEPMLGGYCALRKAEPAIDARVFVAPSLDARTRAFLERRAREHRVEIAVVPAGASVGEFLPAFDASLVTSGTATLEAALADAPPVIVYRASAATELAARALLSTPYIGLPNILLGRGAYTEVLGAAATPEGLHRALADTLERREILSRVAIDVRACFRSHESPSRTVASILAGFMDTPAQPEAHATP